MSYEPVETIGDHRARGTTGRPVGPEHEVIDQKLRTALEKVRQRGTPAIGFEPILLVDPHPRQLLPPSREFVAAPREFLLSLEQLEPRREPNLTCAGHVHSHRYSPVVVGHEID